MTNIKQILLLFALACTSFLSAQTDPEIVSWLQNNSITGTYYVSGNSTALENNILVNCQVVEYSDDYVYVTTAGVPAYATGPFQDGNPSQASNQGAIYRINRNPLPGTGDATTTPGNIGVFINGVSLFDYRDGVAWNSITNALCGGPGNPPCPGGMGSTQDWNRDAIPAEQSGFDCSKAHPAMGNYHHHQNPSAFDLDLQVVSDVCNLYDADGLYAIDPDEHAPLIGFAYDGYPIYGAYGFANADGSGGVVRIQSSYQLRDITERSEGPNGEVLDQGPDVDATYFLGYFREDYEYVASADASFLDEHNGRFAETPEYPEGIYAYYATVDENWNSTYPYVIGPTYYGTPEDAFINNVNEATTIYTGLIGVNESLLEDGKVTVFPNPSSDLIAIQYKGVLKINLNVSLFDAAGKLVIEKRLNAGSTISYIDTQTLYAGTYILRLSDGVNSIEKQVVLTR